VVRARREPVLPLQPAAPVGRGRCLVPANSFAEYDFDEIQDVKVTKDMSRPAGVSPVVMSEGARLLLYALHRASADAHTPTMTFRCGRLPPVGSGANAPFLAKSAHSRTASACSRPASPAPAWVMMTLPESSTYMYNRLKACCRSSVVEHSHLSRRGAIFSCVTCKAFDSIARLATAGAAYAAG
jgi:hypothetical protein